jgi:hypothetical protein
MNNAIARELTARELDVKVMKARMRKLKEDLDEFWSEDDKSLEAMGDKMDYDSNLEYIHYLEKQQNILRMMINLFIEQFI